jgi:hypothetical protein
MFFKTLHMRSWESNTQPHPFDALQAANGSANKSFPGLLIAAGSSRALEVSKGYPSSKMHGEAIWSHPIEKNFNEVTAGAHLVYIQLNTTLGTFVLAAGSNLTIRYLEV